MKAGISRNVCARRRRPARGTPLPSMMRSALCRSWCAKLARYSATQPSALLRRDSNEVSILSSNSRSEDDLLMAVEAFASVLHPPLLTTGTVSDHRSCMAKTTEKLSTSSSCRCIDPIGLHEEISRDFPTCMDFLDHL